jgi:hypothetical protein
MNQLRACMSYGVTGGGVTIHNEKFLHSKRHGVVISIALFSPERQEKEAFGPLFKQVNDRAAYDRVVNGRPARTLYFSRETRKEEGRNG